MKGGDNMTTILEARPITVQVTKQEDVRERPKTRTLAESFNHRGELVRRRLVSEEAAGREMRELAVLYLIDNRRFLQNLFIQVGPDLEFDTKNVQLVNRNARDFVRPYEDWVRFGGLVARSLELQIKNGHKRL